MISILYVDDEPALLELARQFLEQTGEFRVDTRTSAGNALATLGTTRYDVILSDYQMPEMDGITFLRHLRARGDDTPFIIFTGRGREEVVIEALNEGADFYLQKGGESNAQFAELTHKIRHAVSRKDAVRAMRKSEQDYRHLIEHASEAIYVVQDDLLRMVNPSLAEMTGYTEPELLGKPYTTFIHPEDRGFVADRYQRRLKGESVPHRYMFRLCRKDRSVRWAELSVVMISWDEHPAVLVFLTDITDRKLTQDALVEREERYHQFFRTTLDCVFITTRDGRWIDFNDALVNMFGYESRDEILQIPVPSIYANPDERAGFLDEVERAGYVKERPLSFRKRDGTVFDSLITIVPLKNPDGSIKAFIGTFRDITERKQAEEALRASEERYRHIFETFEDLYYETDPSGIITILSPSVTALTGWAGEDLVGKPATFLYVNPGDRIRLLEELEREGRVRDYELMLKKRDGTQTPVSLSARRICHTDGTPAGVAGILRDMTSRKQTERSLKESEETHRILLDQSTDPIFSFFPDGTYRYVNQAFADGVGKTVDQIIGKKIWDVFDKEEADKRFSALSTVFTSGQEKVIEVRVPNPGGDRYYVTTIVPVRGERGAVVTAICSSKDITERKRAEDALRESERKFRSLAESSNDVVMRIDRDHRHLYVNPAIEQQAGFTPEQMIGKTHRELGFPEDFVRSIELMIDTVFRTGTRTRTEVRLGNGHWVDIVAVPEYSADEAVFCVIMTGRDITERKRAEAELADRFIFQQALIDTIPYPIFIKDASARFVGCNRAYEQVFSTTREYMAGRTVLDLEYLPPDDRKKFQDEDLNVIEEAARRSYELPIRYADGEIHMTLYSVDGFRLADGRPGGLIGMLVDISDRRKMEESLLQANRKLSLLSGITRHDISNQIAVLRGFIALLNPELPKEKFTEFTRKIDTASRNILTMIQFTKDYEAIGASAPAWQDLRGLVSRATQQVQTSAIAIINNIPEGAEIYADPLIEKVFYNLIDNTLRHGGARISEIRFFCQPSPGGYCIICEDNGEGVPEDQKEKIFLRGFGKNTGLGLALSREILDITAISIRETGSPGAGARFEISAPAATFRYKLA